MPPVPQKKTPAASGKVQALGDDALGTIRLDGKKLDANLTGSITQDGPLIRSIEQPSGLTLVVNDPERYLARGGYWQRRSDLEIDDLWFRMVRMEKTGDLFTLEFEDREVALLSRHTKPRRASRADVTRAEFLRSLVREEPHIPFVSRALHTRQRIGTRNSDDQKTLDTQRLGNRSRGISENADLRIKGKRANRSQIRYANQVLGIAEDVGAGPKATKALVSSCIVESLFSNPMVATDHDSIGILQVRPSLHGRDVAASVEKSVRAYLTGNIHGGAGFTGTGGAIKVAKDHPDYTVQQVAAATNMSANLALGAAYIRELTKWAGEADKIIAAYGGTGGTPDSDTSGGAYVEQYSYTRGEPGGEKGENTWECGVRLAEEVRWRWFCVAGVIYFDSDYELFRSQPRMTLGEDSPGVDEINYSLDAGDRVPDQVTITGRASRWAAPPGTIITLEETERPADGAWLVTEIQRESLTNPQVTITLGRIKPPALEPASTVGTRDGDDTRDGGTNAGDVRGGATGTVTVQSGANRPGVGLKPQLLEFLRYVAGKTNESIVVTTGTQHDKLTTNGNVSNHWNGNGADLAFGGDARSSTEVASKGDNIATAALIVCGVARAEARRLATSGALNFSRDFTWTHDGKTYTVEIGWRTDEGGNHYNHVHIGVT